jgi:hypothetical protein
MYSIGRTFVAAAALAGSTSAAGAQTVRGVVLDHASAPVPGVVVQLLDSASRVSGRALSNDRGEFRVAATRPGSYRLNTLRIGYRPSTSEPIALAAGAEVERKVTLSGVRVVLDTMRVVTNNVCRAFTDSGAATYRVWEQVRAALTATQLTASARVISATTVAYERTLDAGGRRVQKQSSNIRSDYVTQPWLTLSPDSLHRLGYVVLLRDNSTVYYAPGLDMLLSQVFVEDHCFRLTTTRNRLGIAFEPVPDRRNVADIRGTLWLNRATSELEALQYRYVNVSQQQEDLAGGEMDFARMKNGAWAVSRWNIRMPVMAQRIRSQAFGGSDMQVTEIAVAGGELALARRGNDTLWSRPPLTLTATVVDSSTGSTLTNARVGLAGTDLEGKTDNRGRVSIAGVLPGQYTVEVRTASLDSVNAVHQSQVTFLDAETSLQIKVPTAQQIGALLCGSRTLEHPGMVLGTLAVSGDTAPPSGIKVFAEWSELSLRNVAGNAVTEAQRHSREARTDASGNFRFCGVPVNTAMIVRVDESVGSSAPTDVKIPPNGRFARVAVNVERSANAMFVGLVVADSTQMPIAGAEVSFPTLQKAATSDERGGVRIADIPPGTHPIAVRRVGYGALDAQLEFSGGRTVDRRLVLGRAVALDSVVVRATERIPSFEEHRKIGLGRFLTREDLEKVGVARLSDVLSNLPGVRVISGTGNHAWVSSSHRVGGTGIRMDRSNPGANVLPDDADMTQGARAVPCYAQVYLDGILMFSGRKSLEPAAAPGMPRQMRFDPLFDINTISPEAIEAIEYYATPASVPMKYGRDGSDCGVVVIHTRRREIKKP